MERVVDVARYICDEYQKMSGEAIDEMKLHKLLYFSQRESFAVTGKPLFADEFEGWRYGPVCVAVRKSFCQGEIISKEIEKISDEAVYIISNVIAQYGELWFHLLFPGHCLLYHLLFQESHYFQARLRLIFLP